MSSYKASPKVSVCVISYNQENYIRQCLQSILDQETDFEFELIVGDDFSTDGTASIIQEFVDKYPGKITPIFNKINIGGTRNYISTHLKASGEYIAHVDGDDVVYPGKLQRQADLLDQRSDICLVWHIMKIFDDNGHISSETHPYLDDVVDTQNITLRDALRFGSLGAASSVMYRRMSAGYLLETNGNKLDYYFSTKILESGNGVRINLALGGYRFNPSIATLSKSSSSYFIGSPMRSLYAEHLSVLFDANPRFRDEIFLNSFFNLLIEIRFFRPTCFVFFILARRSFSIAALKMIPRYFSEAFRLRSKC